MPAVRFEDKAFTDVRLALLAKELGWHLHRAFGAMLAVWSHCTEHNTVAVKPKILDLLGDHEGFSRAIVECDLGEESNGSIRIRGAEERIGWLAKRRDALAEARKNRWADPTDGQQTTDDTCHQSSVRDLSTDVSVIKQTTDQSSNRRLICHQTDENSNSKNNSKNSKRELLDRVRWPDGMRTPEAEAALAEWVDYRRESGKTVRTVKTLNALLAKSEWQGDPSLLCAAVRHSIAQGYQGCFAPSQGANGRPDESQAYLARLEAAIAKETQ